ncbi:uncharacterized protein LOC144420000 [Styela clava]
MEPVPALTIVVDFDNVLESGVGKEIARTCESCGKTFPSIGRLLQHKRQHKHRQTVTEGDITDAWCNVSNNSTIPNNVLAYFIDVCNRNRKTTNGGSDFMSSFGKDAIEKIPSLIPEMPRTRLLQTVRKVFDKLAIKQASKDTGKLSRNMPNLNKDEIFIIEYIGGHILQRMRKLTKNPEEYDCICSLICKEPQNPPDSLITVLQNKDYGSLTTPAPELVQFLVELEKEFRKGYKHNKILFNILDNINLNDMSIALRNIITLDQIEKMSLYYLKIRCYQKARVLNDQFNHPKD